MNEAPAAPRPAPGKRVSFALAVLMHLLLAAVLVYGVHWQTQQPKTVTVDLVSAVPPAPTSEPEPKPEPAPEPPPPPKPEPRPEPKPEPKPEPVKPPPKTDIAQKEKEKPKKPDPPAPPKPEPPKPAPDPFKEQMERETRDMERRRIADEARREHEQLRARQTAAAQAGELDKYINAIKGKVRGNIVMTGDPRGNPEAVFEVTQLPSGEVLDVRLLKASGNPVWDAATERAIRKSSPLPKPGRPELFQRELKLTFRPQED